MRIQRVLLIEKLNQKVYCEGIIFRQNKQHTLLKFVKIDEIEIDHIWMNSSIFFSYPLYSYLSFFAKVDVYLKKNGVYSFELIEIEELYEINPIDIIKNIHKEYNFLEKWNKYILNKINNR